MSWTLALVHETTFEAWMKQTVENFTLGCTPPCCPIVHDQGELLAVYLYSTFQATRLSCAEMQEDHRPCRLRIPMSIPKLYRLLCNLLWCWAYYHEYSASLIPVMAQAGAPHHKLDLFLDRFFFFFLKMLMFLNSHDSGFIIGSDTIDWWSHHDPHKSGPFVEKSKTDCNKHGRPQTTKHLISSLDKTFRLLCKLALELWA